MPQAQQVQQVQQIPIYIMMPKPDQYDLVLIAMMIGMSMDLAERNKRNKSRKYWYDRLARRLQIKQESSYSGMMRENVADKAERFQSLLQSDVNSFLKLRGDDMPGLMSALDIYEVAILNVMESFIKGIIKRNNDFNRLEWCNDLLTMVQNMAENLYEGDFPDEMINRAVWLDKMLSVDMKIMMEMLQS